MHIEALRNLDFKISEDDTVISSKYIFYSEAGGFIPQNTQDTLAVCLK